MARILSHPFRLAINGTIATVEQQSEAADTEQLAIVALTVLGERPLAPGFGISDPTYATVEPGEVVASAAVYGPAVTIRTIDIRDDGELTQLVDIAFE